MIIAARSTNKCCLKYGGSEYRLVHVMSCRVSVPQSCGRLQRRMVVLKTEDCNSPYCHSPIGTALHSIMLECLILKIIVSLAELSFIKKKS